MNNKYFFSQIILTFYFFFSIHNVTALAPVSSDAKKKGIFRGLSKLLKKKDSKKTRSQTNSQAMQNATESEQLDSQTQLPTIQEDVSPLEESITVKKSKSIFQTIAKSFAIVMAFPFVLILYPLVHIITSTYFRAKLRLKQRKNLRSINFENEESSSQNTTTTFLLTEDGKETQHLLQRQKLQSRVMLSIIPSILFGGVAIALAFFLPIFPAWTILPLQIFALVAVVDVIVSIGIINFFGTPITNFIDLIRGKSSQKSFKTTLSKLFFSAIMTGTFVVMGIFFASFSASFFVYLPLINILIGGYYAVGLILSFITLIKKIKSSKLAKIEDSELSSVSIVISVSQLINNLSVSHDNINNSMDLLNKSFENIVFYTLGSFIIEEMDQDAVEESKKNMASLLLSKNQLQEHLQNAKQRLKQKNSFIDNEKQSLLDQTTQSKELLQKMNLFIESKQISLNNFIEYLDTKTTLDSVKTSKPTISIDVDDSQDNDLNIQSEGIKLLESFFTTKLSFIANLIVINEMENDKNWTGKTFDFTTDYIKANRTRIMEMIETQIESVKKITESEQQSIQTLKQEHLALKKYLKENKTMLTTNNPTLLENLQDKKNAMMQLISRIQKSQTSKKSLLNNLQKYNKKLQESA